MLESKINLKNLIEVIVVLGFNFHVITSTDDVFQLRTFFHSHHDWGSTTEVSDEVSNL